MTDEELPPDDPELVRLLELLELHVPIIERKSPRDTDEPLLESIRRPDGRTDR